MRVLISPRAHEYTAVWRLRPKENIKVGERLREMIGKQKKMENPRQGCCSISHRGVLTWFP